MPRIIPSSVEGVSRDNYPAPYTHPAKGRVRRRIGDAGGLTQFGVNLTTLPAGSESAVSHYHMREDECVYIVSGDVVLVEGSEEIPLTAGDFATFKAGVEVGHAIENRSDADAIIIEIGSRTPEETALYPGRDLKYVRRDNDDWFERLDGSRYLEG